MTVNLPTTVQNPLMSPQLSTAIKTPEEWTYPDDSVQAVLRDGTWELPKVITKSLKAEAARMAVVLRGRMVPAQKEAIREWLKMLGVLCAGNATVADARMKVGAYSAMLNHPASCFTKESLDRAGRRFKFVPSYAELVEFLDAESAPARLAVTRLEKIAAADETTERKAGERLLRDMPPDQREAAIAEAYRKAGMVRPGAAKREGETP